MKKFKRIAPTILIMCALLLSGCAGKTGKKATNIDVSTGEVVSQDSSISKDITDNIKNYLKNVPSLDNISASDEFAKYDFNTELEKRKNNFVFCSETDVVAANDKVNVTFVEITLSSGDSIYEINFDYDFDLSSGIDDSFKNGLIGKEIGKKTETIQDCKLPDGTTATVKVKINYVTRKVENFDSFKSFLPSGSESYDAWLKSALDKAAIVNDAWNQILKQTTVDENAAGYKEYFDKKFNDACEYYSFYNGENFDKEALKAIIKDQVKKELVAYYYASEYSIDHGNYSDDELKNIALYYGYSKDSFKKKFSKDVVDNTMLIDMVGIRIFEEVYDKESITDQSSTSTYESEVSIDESLTSEEIISEDVSSDISEDVISEEVL